MTAMASRYQSRLLQGKLASGLARFVTLRHAAGIFSSSVVKRADRQCFALRTQLATTQPICYSTFYPSWQAYSTPTNDSSQPFRHQFTHDRRSYSGTANEASPTEYESDPRLADICARQLDGGKKMRLQYLALQTYKDIYGDLHISPSFVVPSTDDRWPIELHGVKLHLVLSSIRSGRYGWRYPEMRKRLEDMGFVWNVYEEKFEKFVAVLSHYKSLHNDLEVPHDFQVPQDSTWPKNLHGFHLGRKVHKVRYKIEEYASAHPEKKQKLDSLGFDWGLPWPLFIRGLEVYLEIYDDNFRGLTEDFVVAQDDTRWPKTMRGFPFGAFAAKVKQNKRLLPGPGVTKRRKELELLKFLPPRFKKSEKANLWKPRYNGYNKIEVAKTKEALEIYRDLHGTLMVPFKFIVPQDSENWPEHLHDFPVGKLCCYIRQRAFGGGHVTDDEKSLVENGLLVDPFLERCKVYYSALIRYKKMKGDVRVPRNFKISDDDTAWPAEMRGLRLGRIVEELRQKRYIHLLPDFEKQLNELDFVWAARDDAFVAMVTAIKIFSALHGPVKVPLDFKCPTTGGQWPTELHGFALGSTAHSARFKFSRFRDSYPDLKRELDNVGFDWSLRYTDVPSALELYKDIYSTKGEEKQFLDSSSTSRTFPELPLDYVIGFQDKRWPDFLRGFPLGAFAANVKEQFESSTAVPALKRHQAALSSIGFLENI